MQTKIKSSQLYNKNITSSRYSGGFSREMTRGDPIGSTSNDSTKDPSHAETINPLSTPSYTPTNFIFIKSRNMPSETPIGYQTASTSTMSTEKPSSKPRYQPILYPYALRKDIQYTQVSLQGTIILFILHIILYFYPSQRYTHTRQQGVLIIFHISVTYTIRQKLSNHSNESMIKHRIKRVKGKYKHRN